MQDPIEVLAMIRQKLAQPAPEPPRTRTGKESADREQAALEFELKNLLMAISREEEQESFSSMMGSDVKPMVQDAVRLKGQTLTEEQSRARRRWAENEPYREKLALSLEKVHYLKPADVTGFKKEGVQHGVYLKVKNGEYRIRDYLDLHNKNLDQAREAVDRFLVDSYEKGMRFVIIIHGKGEFTKPQAMLKSFVFQWLKDAEPVLACHHAMAYHGGPGAIYVLLKKCDRLRDETRERMA